MTKIDRLVAATEAVATLLGRASHFRDYLSNLDVPGDCLDGLLHQLRKDLEEVGPLMDEFRRPFAAACERPPDPVGRCEGSSYHLLAFNIALTVYEAMARHQWAASAIVGGSRDEPILRGNGERAAIARRDAADALHRWLPFNCESLKKMIEHESVRAEEKLREAGPKALQTKRWTVGEAQRWAVAAVLALEAQGKKVTIASLRKEIKTKCGSRPSDATIRKTDFWKKAGNRKVRRPRPKDAIRSTDLVESLASSDPGEDETETAAVVEIERRNGESNERYLERWGTELLNRDQAE